MRNRRIKIISISEQQMAFSSHDQRRRDEQDGVKRCKKMLVISLMVFMLISTVLILIGLNKNTSSIGQSQSTTTIAITDPKINDQQTLIQDASTKILQNIIEPQLVEDIQNQAEESFILQVKNQQKIQKQVTEQQVNTNTNIIKDQIQLYVNKAVLPYIKKRITIFSQVLASYRKQNQSQLKDHLWQPYNITIAQFTQALSLIQYAPLIEKNLHSLDIIKEEYQYFQNKYNISRYREIPMCVVVPSYKNFKRYRYYFNLYTILQQQYTNYRVIIIDDASDDKTAESIEYEMTINPSIRQRVTLIKNSKRQYHMANFYKAIYGHCKKGEILLTIDGDDQLIGKMVFKTINAAYHRTKGLAIYTNHLMSKREVAFDIGMSRSYSQQTKLNNSYRYDNHYYSHLRSTWTDLFFLVKEQAFKSSKGIWFNSAVDNAIFYPIFEMSCGQVIYLSQIMYKYNTYTGNNVDNMDYGYRKSMSDEIKSQQRYKCLKQWNLEAYNLIKSYMN